MKLKAQMNEILSEFDFDKLARHMEYDNWRICIGNNLKIPTSYELERFAKNMLLDIIKRYKKNKEKYLYSFCGPFKVTCINKVLTLDGVITSWTIY